MSLLEPLDISCSSIDSLQIFLSLPILLHLFRPFDSKTGRESMLRAFSSATDKTSAKGITIFKVCLPSHTFLAHCHILFLFRAFLFGFVFHAYPPGSLLASELCFTASHCALYSPVRVECVSIARICRFVVFCQVSIRSILPSRFPPESLAPLPFSILFSIRCHCDLVNLDGFSQMLSLSFAVFYLVFPMHPLPVCPAFCDF